MKKILVIILAVAIAIALVGCVNVVEPEEPAEETEVLEEVKEEIKEEADDVKAEVKAPEKEEVKEEVSEEVKPEEVKAPEKDAPEKEELSPNEKAHKAYIKMLKDYAWMKHCPSDIPGREDYEEDPDEYAAYYYCLDIDNNGIDELIILAGEGAPSYTFFTFDGSSVQPTGSLFLDGAILYDIKGAPGMVMCMLYDTPIQHYIIELVGHETDILEINSYDETSDEHLAKRDEEGALRIAHSYSVTDFYGLEK